MARPSFPATVRASGTKILRDGYRYDPPDNVDQSNPGPAEKRRPKSTISWETHTVRFRLPWAEWLTFKDWVRVDLVGGVLVFDWQPPDGAAPILSKFVLRNGQPFSVTPAPGNSMRVECQIKSVVL